MYNPDELELKIDRFRMDRDWNGVLKSIEIYAHVFAVGAAVHSKQHENLEHIRAYYWTVMAELMLEKKHDYLKAFGCVKRSSEIGPHYIDWRIMLIRVLLGRTLAQNRESQVRRHSFFSPNPHIKTPSEKSDNISVCDTLSIVDPADYDPGVMLDGVLHVSFYKHMKCLYVLCNTYVTPCSLITRTLYHFVHVHCCIYSSLLFTR